MKKHKTCTKIGLGGSNGRYWEIINYQSWEQVLTLNFSNFRVDLKYFCKGYRSIHIYYFGVSARLYKSELICTFIERLTD